MVPTRLLAPRAFSQRWRDCALVRDDGFEIRHRGSRCSMARAKRSSRAKPSSFSGPPNFAASRERRSTAVGSPEVFRGTGALLRAAKPRSTRRGRAGGRRTRAILWGEQGFDALREFGLGHAGGPVHAHDALAIDQNQSRGGTDAVAQHHGFADGMRGFGEGGVGSFPPALDLLVFLRGGGMVDFRHVSVTAGRRQHAQAARLVLLPEAV